MSRGLLNFAIVGSCILLGLLVVVPMIQNARNAARRTASRNNLRGHGLAMLNYHSVYNSFPIGGDISPDGTPKHGWYTRLMPYQCSSPLYAAVNFEFGWEHPENKAVFQREYWLAEIHPSSDDRFSAEDFGLLHYLGNPNILHRNSCVSTTMLPNGMEHCWMIGEICGDYQPWGYPFNWRELKLPLNDGTGFGNPIGQETQLVMADGSVRSVVNEVAHSVIDKLNAGSPSVNEAETARPNRKFAAKSQRSARHPIVLHAKDGTAFTQD